MVDGKRLKLFRIVELTKCHSSVTAVAFSHKYRLYLIVTSGFKMFFMNELYNIVSTLDMSSIRLVNFVHFYDE